MKYKIKDIITFKTGYAFKKSDVSDTGIDLVKIGNLKNNKVILPSGVKIKEDTKFKDFIINKGDILMALTGDPVYKGNIQTWVGRTSIYLNNKVAYLNQRVCKLIPNEKIILGDYLYYWLIRHDKTYEIAELFHGSANQANISHKEVGEMFIELPSLEIQKKASKILSDIDKRINLNNEINNNLYELILNNFINFLEENKNSGIVKLEDCVEKINTGADAIQRAPIVDYDTGIRCIRVGDMTNGRDYHSWGFTKMTDKDFENYKLMRNDIVITRTAVNGLTYMITDEENVVCNNGNIRLRVNNKYNPLYIYLNTKTQDFRNYIDRIKSETSVRPNMKVEYFTNYLIKKIDLDKQNEFCNKTEIIMKKIQNNKKESYNLEQLRNTLLPKLMNGEMDLDKIEI